MKMRDERRKNVFKNDGDDENVENLVFPKPSEDAIIYVDYMYENMIVDSGNISKLVSYEDWRYFKKKMCNNCEEIQFTNVSVFVQACSSSMIHEKNSVANIISTILVDFLVVFSEVEILDLVRFCKENISHPVVSNFFSHMISIVTIPVGISFPVVLYQSGESFLISLNAIVDKACEYEICTPQIAQRIMNVNIPLSFTTLSNMKFSHSQLIKYSCYDYALKSIESDNKNMVSCALYFLSKFLELDETRRNVIEKYMVVINSGLYHMKLIVLSILNNEIGAFSYEEITYLVDSGIIEIIENILLSFTDRLFEQKIINTIQLLTYIVRHNEVSKNLITKELYDTMDGFLIDQSVELVSSTREFLELFF